MNDVLPHWHKKKNMWVECLLPLSHTAPDGSWCEHGMEGYVPGDGRCIYAGVRSQGKACVDVFAKGGY